MSIRSLVYAGPAQVQWREAPEPRLRGPSEAIVAPAAASRCDFDRDIVSGKTPLRAPFAIGHEAVVRVVEAGDSVRTVGPGDLAVLVPNIACGQCARCTRGLTAHCLQTPPGSAYGVGAGFGGLFDDLVRVPYADAMLTPVPDEVDPADVAAAGDSLSLGYAITSQAVGAGPAHLAVFGRGEHGLYQVAFAARLGSAGSLIYVDASSARRGIAAELGATALAEAPERVEETFDVIVDASGNEQWLRHAITLLEPEGVIECLGGHFGDIRLPGFAMYLAGTRIRFGQGSTSKYVQPTIDAIADGLLQPSTLWATRIDWDELPAAYIDEQRKLITTRHLN